MEYLNHKNNRMETVLFCLSESKKSQICTDKKVYTASYYIHVVLRTPHASCTVIRLYKRGSEDYYLGFNGFNRIDFSQKAFGGYI